MLSQAAFVSIPAHPCPQHTDFLPQVAGTRRLYASATAATSWLLDVYALFRREYTGMRLTCAA